MGSIKEIEKAKGAEGLNKNRLESIGAGGAHVPM